MQDALLAIAARPALPESGGSGEALPCYTMALAPIEAVVKYSPNRVRCGAPWAGEDQRRSPPKQMPQAGNRDRNFDFDLSIIHLWHRSAGISGGLGGTEAKERGRLRGSQHP